MKQENKIPDANTYDHQTHFYGRIWMWIALILILCVPVSICSFFDAWPGVTPVLKGLLGVAPIYWTVGVIEVITYTPMLGTGGSYLSFVTGNLSSLKVPAALNAMDGMKVKPGSEEGEIMSTLAVATSSIVTTVLIAAGVFLLAQITPILNSPILAPAFDNILPALFGGLGVVYISRNWKVAITPVAFMILLFICFPSLSGSVSILVPVGALISLGMARLLYKKEMI